MASRPSVPDEPQEETPERGTLLIEDPSLRLGFTQIPNLVMYARNLSNDAKLLYGFLVGYAWQDAQCFPGYGRLCADMQMGSHNTVRKSMRELEEARLIRQKRRGLGRTNLYILCDLRESKIDLLESHQARVLERQRTDATERHPADAYKDSGNKDTVRRMGATAPHPRSITSGARRGGKTPYTEGAYGVCPQCGMNPCDVDCPTQQTIAGPAITTPPVTRRRGRSPAQ